MAIRALVQHKIGLFPTGGVIAHLVKQILAKTGPLDGLQKLLWDNHVGIDIEDVQRRRYTRQLVEFLHCLNSTCLKRAHIGQIARYRGRNGHFRADKMGPPAAPLPAFKIPVRG